MKVMQGIEIDSTGIQLKDSSSDRLITSSRAWLEVGDIMSPNVTTVAPDETVVSAVKTMSEKKISCIVVVADAKVVGILTETDILERVALRDNDFDKRSVVEIMSSPVATVCRDLSVLEAADISAKRHIKRLPVLENNRLVGIVTQTDIVRTMTSYGVWRDVADIMSRDVAGVQKTATVAEAAQLMTSRNISCVVALEGDEAVGILTERDLLSKVVAQQRDPTRTTMEEVMSSPVSTLPPGHSVFSASRTMEAKGIRRLVVTDGKRLCGIVAQTDIFRAAKRKLDAEEDENRRLLKESKNNIFTADLEGKTTYVNPAFLRQFEVSDPSEFIGQPFLPERFWLDPKDRIKTLRELRKGNVEIEELSLKTAQGKRIHVTLFSTLTRNTRGELNGSQGILYDVSEKKELIALRAVEEALQKERDFSESLVDTAQTIILVLDTEGRIVRFNPYMEEISGYRLEEVQGQDWFDTFLPKRDHARIREVFAVAKKDVRTRGNINAIVTKEGQERQIEWYDKTLKDRRGKTLGMLAIGQDATERKQAEAALRESEQRFMDVLHTSGDAIMLIDGATFIDCNEATARMLGYSNREAFLLTHPGDISPPAQPDGRNSFEKANELIKAAFEEGFQRFEWMHRKADGRDFPVEVSLTSIPYKGKTILHCLLRDLTEPKRVEEQLRTLHRAVEQSSSTIVITDVDGKIEYGNPQFEATTGYTLEEAYGQNPRVLKSGQQSPEFYTELWETISSGRVWRGEFHNRRKDGSLYWEAACISPVFDAQGRITQYVAVKDDVSARKRSEEERERSQRMLQKILESMPVGVAIIGKDKIVRQVNSAALAMMGYDSEDQVVGRECHQTLCPAEKGMCPILDLGKEEDNAERVLVTRDKTQIPILKRVITVNLDGEDVLLEAFVDISERKRAEEQLRRASEQDPLTGVFNRRAFHARFSQEWERAARHGHPLACVMLDLDFFKRINDTHGHATGDETLKAIAHLLRDQGRPGDIPCRYGGEEFCILLPETDEAGAARWAERVRLAISATPIRVGDLSLRVAASFGVAERLADTASPEQLVELADQALAVAKQSGRNRVVRFGPLSEPVLDPRDEQAAAGPIDGISARDVMSVALVCPNQNDTVQQVADLFLQLRIDSAPVVNEAGTVTGIVAEADLLTRTALGEGWEDKICDVMRTDVVCYEENTPIAQVYDFLSRVSVPRVIVVNHGRPSGVISRATLLRWFRNWVATREPGSSEQRAHLDQDRERRRAGIVKTAQAAEERAAYLRQAIVMENDDFSPCVVGEATRLQSLANDLLGHCRS